MTIVPEFEWKQLDVNDYANFDALEVWGAVSLGIVMMIVVKQPADPIDFETEEEAASASPIWMLWAMSHDSLSGGAECIDGYESLAAAQATAENDKEQMLEYAKELLDS